MYDNVARVGNYKHTREARERERVVIDRCMPVERGFGRHSCA